MQSTEHPSDAEELKDLPFSEQLVLWGVRLWVQGLKNETNIQSQLRTAFKLAGAPEGHPALDDLMTVITVSADQGIDIRCTKCPSISPDELRILGALAAWQHEKDDSLINLFLAAWLPSTARRVAQTPIAQLGGALRAAKLVLRERKPVKFEAARHFNEARIEDRVGPLH